MEITVFTPTYNRGYILQNAYESLKRQSCKNFEWIIVDDGSTDDTKSMVDSWISENQNFQIRYIKVPNGGKMRATNIATQMATGTFFLTLDSDDYLTDDAIEKIILRGNEIREHSNIAGIAFQRGYFNGDMIGRNFNESYLDASPLERDYWGIQGDKTEIFYTNLLKKYPFQEFKGEKFISEGVVWCEICFYENKVLRWYQDIIYKCEYRPDGYSASSKILSNTNPKGILYNLKSIIKMRTLAHNGVSILAPNLLEKLKIWHKYYIPARYNNYSFFKIKKDLNISLVEMILLISGHYLNFFKKIFLCLVFQKKQ